MGRREELVKQMEDERAALEASLPDLRKELEDAQKDWAAVSPMLKEAKDRLQAATVAVNEADRRAQRRILRLKAEAREYEPPEVGEVRDRLLEMQQETRDMRAGDADGLISLEMRLSYLVDAVRELTDGSMDELTTDGARKRAAELLANVPETLTTVG